MQHVTTTRSMWGQFFSVSLPVFLTQLSLVLGSFFAATMAGHHGRIDLAGVAVGVNLWMPVLMTSIGLFMGVTPIISHLLGAGKTQRIPTIIRQAVYLAAAIGIVVTLLGACAVRPVLDILALEPAVDTITYRFLLYIGLGIIPTFISITLRNIVDSHGLTRISLMIMTCGFLVNIVLNYCFIYGAWIFPDMGGAGTGVAIALSNTFNCLCFLVLMGTCAPFKHYRVFAWEQFRPDIWRDQLKIGLPIGGANFLEISLFAIIGLLVTTYGTDIIAAHQAANNFSNLAYTLPLSAGIATTILCGYELGGGRRDYALRYARMAQLFTIIIALLLFGFTYLHMDRVAGLYSSDEDMIALISTFVPFAMCFIFADATGTPIQGALRGYKDVRFIFCISFICYWLVGLGTGGVFAHLLGFGPYGYWIGAITGLAAASVAYNLRLIYLNRK